MVKQLISNFLPENNELLLKGNNNAYNKEQYEHKSVTYRNLEYGPNVDHHVFSKIIV